MHYLDDPSKELSGLLAYPHVMAAFVKHNTTMPSSAPVERLFSIGGCIDNLLHCVEIGSPMQRLSSC